MLWALVPVIAAAVYALLRPDRLRIVVGSIELWREAIASRAGGGVRRRKRNLAWLCVLLGCLLGITALARPMRHTTVRVRRLGVIISPSAEFIGDGGRQLRAAATDLLARLGKNDRVRLILPDVLGGASEWLSINEARQRVGNLSVIPARWDQFRFPASPGDVQQTLAVLPAGASGEGISADAVVSVATSLPAVTIDALSAVPLGDDQTQVFVALKDHTDMAHTVVLHLTSHDSAGLATERTVEVSITAGQRAGVVEAMAAGLRLRAQLSLDRQLAGATDAYLVRREAATRKVAMVGGDDPMIRRFIAADRSLQLTADADEAGLVIAMGEIPPADKPALVINPPRAKDADAERVLLAEASVAVDDELLAGVDFAEVAVREMAGWRIQPGGMKPLVVVNDRALILRSKTDLVGSRPRRVLVAFDIAPVNTNWTATESFVVFMANAVRWLAPKANNEMRYEYFTPLQVGRPDNWRPADETVDGDGPLLQPGVYRDGDGQWQAVSLVGLRGGQPARNTAEQLADVNLVEPTYADTGRELWPVAAIAAMLLWIGGWLTAGRR
jgi:hypothetical protein